MALKILEFFLGHAASGVKVKPEGPRQEQKSARDKLGTFMAVSWLHKWWNKRMELGNKENNGHC